MAGLLTLVIMSLVLGAVSFGVGVLPLSFAFSKSHIARLSTLGTGLLLGAALGIIIPEGVETLIESSAGSEPPISKMALALLLGFTFMLLVEQLVSGHNYALGEDSGTIALDRPKRVEFDAELGELEHSDQGNDTSDPAPRPPSPRFSKVGEESRKLAYPLTLGLFMHGLSDGLALGASALAEPAAGDASDITVVVFFALIIHKAPTTLALTTSLLSMALTRTECKRHIALFASSTPIGALVSYGLFSVLGIREEWTGLAVLFSGGSFLYVATVLQPVSDQSQQPSSAEEVGRKTRLALLVAGMFIPFSIAQMFGHGH